MIHIYFYLFVHFIFYEINLLLNYKVLISKKKLSIQIHVDRAKYSLLRNVRKLSHITKSFHKVRQIIIAIKF